MKTCSAKAQPTQRLVVRSTGRSEAQQVRQSGLRGEGSREELSEWEPGLFPGGGGLLGGGSRGRPWAELS